jgi:hypothetical protein
MRLGRQLQTVELPEFKGLRERLVRQEMLAQLVFKGQPEK